LREKTQRSLSCAWRQAAGYAGQQAVPATVVQTRKIDMLCLPEEKRREEKRTEQNRTEEQLF
jgi:hypothetical protein